MSRSSAAQGAAFVSTQIANAHTEPGFVEIPFVLRALDWLRAAMNMLLEAWRRRLRLVGWAAAPSVFAACLCEAPKGPNRPELTITGCSKRWNCGLRFKVEFPALALSVLKHWHAYISEEQPTFGRAPPSARRGVRLRCEAEANDTKHPGRRCCASKPLITALDRRRRAAHQK